MGVDSGGSMACHFLHRRPVLQRCERAHECESWQRMHPTPPSNVSFFSDRLKSLLCVDSTKGSGPWWTSVDLTEVSSSVFSLAEMAPRKDSSCSSCPQQQK